MDVTGKLTDVSMDWETQKFRLTFEVEENQSVINEVDGLKGNRLTIAVKKWRKKRSLDANSMMWACIGQIASALRADKWDVYLMMLKRYGKFTYIVVRESAVEAMKRQWRESEVIGEVVVNGQKGVQMLCYFGSSTMNSQEFSVLLDGVISEMNEMQIPVPPTREVQAALERYEEEWRKRNQS